MTKRKDPKDLKKRGPKPKATGPRSIEQAVTGEVSPALQPKKKAGKLKNVVLKGMEEVFERIEELETLASAYVTEMDRRMEALRNEVALKQQILRSLHRHGRKTYKSQDAEIILVEGAEAIKVKVRKHPDAEESEG